MPISAIWPTHRISDWPRLVLKAPVAQFRVHRNGQVVVLAASILMTATGFMNENGCKSCTPLLEKAEDATEMGVHNPRRIVSANQIIFCSGDLI